MSVWRNALADELFSTQQPSSSGFLTLVANCQQHHSALECRCLINSFVDALSCSCRRPENSSGGQASICECLDAVLPACHAVFVHGFGCRYMFLLPALPSSFTGEARTVVFSFPRSFRIASISPSCLRTHNWFGFNNKKNKLAWQTLVRPCVLLPKPSFTCPVPHLRC